VPVFGKGKQPIQLLERHFFIRREEEQRSWI